FLVSCGHFQCAGDGVKSAEHGVPSLVEPKVARGGEGTRGPNLGPAERKTQWRRNFPEFVGWVRFGFLEMNRSRVGKGGKTFVAGGKMFRGFQAAGFLAQQPGRWIQTVNCIE